jgi:hypothetical protein
MSSGLLLRASLVLVALGLLAGCSDDDSSSTPTPGSCNDLTNDGPGVNAVVRTAGTTPMGGTIEDGRYLQTGLDYYADPGETVPPDLRTLSAVFELEAGALEAVVGASIGEDEQSDTFSATYSASGTVLTLTYSCPDPSVSERPNFTATPSELRLFYRIADETATAEVILTKQ